jgi:hypothetical protein
MLLVLRVLIAWRRLLLVLRGGGWAAAAPACLIFPHLLLGARLAAAAAAAAAATVRVWCEQGRGKAAAAYEGTYGLRHCDKVKLGEECNE